MRGFTLIELIFVLVIIGILSFVAVEYIPRNNKLIADKEALKGIILAKKSNAMGFEANMENSDEKSLVCIKLDKDSINEAEKSTKTPYIFTSEISAKSGDSTVDEICFDSIGRVHCADIEDDLSSLCHENVIITLKLNNREKTLTINAYTGAVF